MLRAFGWQLVRRPRLVGGHELIGRRPGQRPPEGRRAMRAEQLAKRQSFFALYIIRSTAVITILPVLTSADARQDA